MTQLEQPLERDHNQPTKMPTKEELEAIKAHLKQVDLAQEGRLRGMFEELMNSDYQKEQKLPNRSEQKQRTNYQ